MAIILSHSSALAFWTNVRIGRSRAFYEGCKIVPACSSPLPSARATQKELARLAMVFKPSALDALALRDDMHVLVKQGRHNDKVRGIRAHSTTHDFSSRVFFQIAPDVFAVSPALCFCQMGEMLDLVDMIRLGDELCGKYAVLRDEIAFSIEPLVRRVTLARRLRELPSAYGRARAVQAMRYVVDDSASPRETVLEIMLALPRCKGGFGFSTPEMNGIIKVGRGTMDGVGAFRRRENGGVEVNAGDARDRSSLSWRSTCVDLGSFQEVAKETDSGILKERAKGCVKNARRSQQPSGSFLKCDLLWRAADVAVEYDSDSFHANAERIERDALRRDLLEHRGIHVLTVTRRRFASLPMMEEFADELRKALGLRRRLLTPKQEHIRHTLHAALLKPGGWN